MNKKYEDISDPVAVVRFKDGAIQTVEVMERELALAIFGGTSEEYEIHTVTVVH